MKKKKLLPLLLAAAMIFTIAPITSYADEISVANEEILLEDDETGELVSEDDSDTTIEDDNSESEDLVPTEDEAVAGGNSDQKIVTIPARQIHLSVNMDQVMNAGDTLQIGYKLKPRDSDDFIVYKSYDRSVAMVSADGLITAVGKGETRIQLKASSGAKIYVYITVNGGSSSSASKIQFADENIMLRKGNSSQLTAITYPLGSSGIITYSSSDTSIAKVSSSGKVTAVNDGTADITASLPNGAKAICTITVYSGIFKGVDVSKWQGTINWKKVKNAGIDFAMIRSSFGSDSVDGCLAANVKGCEENDIPYGFYHYTYASSVAEAKQEAKFFIKTIKKYSPDYPVVLDIENELYMKLGKKKVTDITVAFMTELENAGYYAMVYSYANFFNQYIDMSRMEVYDIWVASWGDIDRLNSFYDDHYGMWQYSASGNISGISGNVDLDYAYKDYKKRIEKAGLNK